ncbi:DUF5688 family protein [Faecalicatena acetigenes]|jgi:hypothetical protein|uniref:DUF5688 family protein n=2 Tax=Lachnospiraceae TaxID=186803 RepID=A0ABT2TCD9_9FIRM|nr:DUF5688 family protein [Faecalicatena acetigenes]MCU6747907.1 DUF5688 family protein [Faecalicatena acetigenes]SCI16550.1 Uncharacterised protein [uncultured Clostridium sp.]
MEYQEFVRAVKEEVNRKLEGGMKAVIYKAVKNNGKEKSGLLIETPGINISPTIYLEEFYEEFEEGESLEKIAVEIVYFYEKVRCEHSWDPEEIRTYDSVKKKIAFKLINTEKNKELLKLAPHISMLDLSIVFYVLLEITEYGSATMLLYNDHLNRWNVSVGRIWEDARKNVLTLLPAQFFTMRSILQGDMEKEECIGNQKGQDLLQHDSLERDCMYVLSNRVRNLGAACILYPKMLERIGGILEEDYYILPSSIHEVVIVPASKGTHSEEMSKMVKEINGTQVLAEEILSDHAYFYECSKKKLKGCSLQSAGIMLG